MTPPTLDTIRAALNLAPFDVEAAWREMSPRGRIERQADPPPKQAGVLALLTGEDGDLRVVLTRRTDRLNGHRGQMSFPGGRRDDGDRDFAHTALRETGEELGIDTSGVDVLGALTPIYIPPSHFDVFPYVGYQHRLPPLVPNPDEVAAVYPVALADLFDPANRIVTEIETVTGTRVVPAYVLGGQVVWGATAVMLCELEVRLRTVLNGTG
ncbi:MAG: CoA pyrophosphatase [Chloroflexi bacterium]|nr:CoA pyrophosphatase [Chloroflexota bacterium]